MSIQRRIARVGAAVTLVISTGLKAVKSLLKPLVLLVGLSQHRLQRSNRAFLPSATASTIATPSIAANHGVEGLLLRVADVARNLVPLTVLLLLQLFRCFPPKRSLDDAKASHGLIIVRHVVGCGVQHVGLRDQPVPQRAPNGDPRGMTTFIDFLEDDLRKLNEIAILQLIVGEGSNQRCVVDMLRLCNHLAARKFKVII